jgi:hypothetical protein
MIQTWLMETDAHQIVPFRKAIFVSITFRVFAKFVILDVNNVNQKVIVLFAITLQRWLVEYVPQYVL